MESGGSSSGNRPVIEFADFRLDPQQRKLSRLDGTPLALNSRAFDTLLALVERRGEVLSKHQLMDAVWPRAVVEENNLNQAISVLRKTLGDSDTNRIIVTVPGRGFCFVAEIRNVTDRNASKGSDNPAQETINRIVVPASSIAKSEPASPDLLNIKTPQQTPDPANRMHKSSGLLRNRNAVVAFVAFIMIFAGLVFWPRKPAPDPIAEKSIAVLPFANISDDPEQDYFSDGLTDELINKLSQVDDLVVTGRNSSFYFKGRDDELRDIGQELGVTHLLQGSVRKAGNQLRITAQLVDVNTNANLWSQNFDREIADIFVIQDEISAAVITALSVTLSAGEFSRPGMTRNVDAYVEYMKANKKVAETFGESALEAIVHGETAVSLDPDFARGWLTLANAYLIAMNTVPSGQTSGFAEKQTEALARAASLAPELRENKIVKYIELRVAGRYAEAEQLLMQLGDLYGQDAELNREYGQFLLQVGRVQESKVALERARRQDPLSAKISTYLVQSMRSANVPADTIRAELNRGLSLGGFEPLFYNYLSLLEMTEKNWPAAMTAIEHVTSRPVYLQLITYIKEDQTQEGLAYLKGLLNDPNIVLSTRLRLLPLFAALYGDPQLALELLQSYKGDPAYTLEPIWHDDFNAMRKLPEFKNWMREYGLVEYWRTTGNWADKCRPAGDDFVCE